jgi:IS1 family transposase
MFAAAEGSPPPCARVFAPAFACFPAFGAYNSRHSKTFKKIGLVGHVNTAVHRFEELIGGHPYSIEVVAVAKDRWRAYIVRIPGVPNAMMPFYGSTPDQAAAQLRQWLTRAYERAASPAVKRAQA